MKNFLILDTSTEVQIVVLVQNNKIKTFKKILGEKKYVSNMVPLIEEVMNVNKQKLKDLDGILVGIGPGSYTGTRVGVLTAKMIALFLKIPLFKISSLILLTSGYKQNFLTSLLDARNDFFFGLSLKNNKIILNEGRYHKNFLNIYKNIVLIKSDTIKIGFERILIYMKEIFDIHSLTPNYLKEI